MAFVPVPNAAEVDIIASLFGQIVENTLTFVSTGTFSPTQLLQLATTVGGWWVANMLPNLSSDYIYLRTEAKDISSVGGATAVNPTGVGTPGASSGSAPGGTAAAVSFRTAFGGRSYRGRNYIAGVPISQLVGNQLFPGFLDAIVAVYNTLETALHADLPAADWCVASRYTAGAPRVAGITTQIVAAVATNYDVDSQRRRLTGRGT